MNWIFLSFLMLVQQTYSYPIVRDWKNTPLIVFDNKKNAVLKKDDELRSPFFAITARLDELDLKLNPDHELFLFKNSKIQINEVFEDSEKPMHLLLMDGSIRLKNQSHGRNKFTNRIESVFFDLNEAADMDALITIDMTKPSVEIKMIKGTWNLSFFAYEKKLTLKAGQQVLFEGVIADSPDQIKYDFLLDQRKVPKGQLGPVKKFDVAKYVSEEKAAEGEIIKKDRLAKQKIKEEARKKKEYEDSFLCKGPFAQINQCAWRLESDKCYRQRCNVSGVWGDKTERPVNDKCTEQFLIGKCDY